MTTENVKGMRHGVMKNKFPEIPFQVSWMYNDKFYTRPEYFQLSNFSVSELAGQCLMNEEDRKFCPNHVDVKISYNHLNAKLCLVRQSEDEFGTRIFIIFLFAMLLYETFVRKGKQENHCSILYKHGV